MSGGFNGLTWMLPIWQSQRFTWKNQALFVTKQTQPPSVQNDSTNSRTARVAANYNFLSLHSDVSNHEEKLPRC
jgi:hypothetical protein